MPIAIHRRTFEPENIFSFVIGVFCNCLFFSLLYIAVWFPRARVCGVGAPGFFCCCFFFGAFCWLPVTLFPDTYYPFPILFPSIYFTPTGSLCLIHKPPLIPLIKPPKTPEILGRLSAICGGRVCESVSVCVAGAVQPSSIPSLYITPL